MRHFGRQWRRGSGTPRTIADGLRGALSERTLRLIRANVDDIVTVSEDSIVAAMRLLFERLKLVIEPSGAVPVAALLEPDVSVQWSPALVAAFVYLVGVLSVGASLLWFWLLSHGAASRVSAFYFLTPIFGLAFGALLLGEAIGPGDAVGLVAVAVGILLVQRG